MAVKINKDQLIKHRFWILVGVTAFLTLGGLTFLQFVSADAAANKLRSDIKKAASTKGTTNPTNIQSMADKAALAQEKEAVVWSNAFKPQASLFAWAPAVEAEFEFLNGKFANDIKISKLTDKAEWPKDTETLHHGALLDVQESWIQIKNAEDKIVKLFRTKDVKITITDDGNKSILWGGDLKAQQGKLVAAEFLAGKYFNDPLTPSEQRAFDTTYRAQIHDILRSVEPLDDKGNGVVQLRNWLYNPDELPDANAKFIRYVTKPWSVNEDFSKEAWIAQENLWIQKEIYRVIREANDAISLFERVGADAKDTGEKRNAAYTFKNSQFALDLVLQSDKESTLSFKIKNLLPRRQKLDLSFRIKMNKGDFASEVVHISGPALMPAGDKADSFIQTIPFPKEGTTPERKGIYQVQQVLTWDTAAVKRIDQISIGSNSPDELSHSHRTFPLGFRPYEEEAKKEEEKKGGGLEAGLGKQGGGDIKKDGGGGNAKPLPHGLWTNRYVEVSDQSRRLPVSVALIVDQDHVDRVLTHFNNSKFRFVASQVLLNHYAGSLQPPRSAVKKEEPGVGVGKIGVPNVGGAKQGPVAGQNLESNMELVLYGIVTLYERHPPRPRGEKK